TGTTSGQSSGDSASQARRFLQRHFGKHGSIEKSTSLCAFLFNLGVNYNQSESEPEQPQQQESQDRTESQSQAELSQQSQSQDASSAEKEPEQPKVQLHTWHLEELPSVQPKLATAIEWRQEQLQIFNCAWHLQNCSWRHVHSSEFQLPNCNCQKIKQTTEYINRLLKVSLPVLDGQQEQLDGGKDAARSPTLGPDVNGNIMSLNSLLQQLNELLEQQNEEQAVR
ncbi:hypothetical protein KR093_000387, partial [Drosophila rubida]